MIRSPSAIVPTVVLLAAAAAMGADPMPPVPLLDQLVRSEHIAFRVISGRISFTSAGLGTRSTSSTGSERTEALQMRLTQNETHLSYQLNSPSEDFSVVVSAADTVQIQRKSKGTTSFASVTYTQKPGQPIVLAVDQDKNLQRIEAPSLWHLLLAAPELCRQHLLAPLGTLGTDWDLEPLWHGIEEGLLQGDSPAISAERARWEALVSQLADDSFARREAADRELRAAGPAALGFLRWLDFAALQPEQQYRIRRMIEAESNTHGSETVEDAVAWLSGDARTWLIFAGRQDVATRQTAAARLAEFLGKPIDFDPQGTEASRLRQLEALRKRLP